MEENKNNTNNRVIEKGTSFSMNNNGMNNNNRPMTYRPYMSNRPYINNPPHTRYYNNVAQKPSFFNNQTAGMTVARPVVDKPSFLNRAMIDRKPVVVSESKNILLPVEIDLDLEAENGGMEEEEEEEGEEEKNDTTKRFCYNCGKIGHIYTNCLNPIMSYGTILYKMRDGVPYYLMVQRSFTPDFKELIRGKFDFDNVEYLRNLIRRITLQEINLIHTYPHKILYANIEKFCKIKKTKLYYDKWKISKENFNLLIKGVHNKSGQFIQFNNLVKEDNPTYYFEPDWGFPKGRRNYKGTECDIECAKREVLEETGISPENYETSSDYYVTEVHVGSNGIKYAHRYYIGKCIPDITCYIDPFNKYQLGEIRKIGWFTIEQALSMIRPYHVEKKKVLLRVHRKITGRVMVVDFNKNNQPITMDRAPIPVDWKE